MEGGERFVGRGPVAGKGAREFQPSTKLDRADAVEAMGAYYQTLSAKPGLTPDRQDQLRAEVRLWFNKSLAIWQDWTSRNLGAPYAAERLNQAAASIALGNKP